MNDAQLKAISEGQLAIMEMIKVLSDQLNTVSKQVMILSKKVEMLQE